MDKAAERSKFFFLLRAQQKDRHSPQGAGLISRTRAPTPITCASALAQGVTQAAAAAEALTGKDEFSELTALLRATAGVVQMVAGAGGGTCQDFAPKNPGP